MYKQYFFSFCYYSIALWLFVASVVSQITPPPPLNGSPVIANNRIYYLQTWPVKCEPPIIDTFPGGALIKDSRAMMKKDNPHILRGTIQIAPSGCLYIEPGTVLRFAPGQGIIVNGTLIARGSELPGGRITMTKLDGADLGRPSGDWSEDARLVMGNTTKDGRLDLMYQGIWRAVCTNYNNFTEIDTNVTCRHLGFLKGNFTYHSFARNLTDYILWERPGCLGTENNLFDCPGASSIMTGRHICDGQEVIAFECEGLRSGLALDHWRGIDFYNSTSEARFQIQNNYKVYMNESLSFLEYLDISYTGLDTYHGRTSEPNIFYQKAAISASPLVPMINNVTIKYGAYDALNLTEITGPIHIANSTISHNRGYGMFIQSSVGRCLINMTQVHHNWGDGIKFYISNLTIFDFRHKFPPGRSFCVQAQSSDMTYPFYQHLDLVQVNGNDRTMVSVGGSCQKLFTTASNMRITVHFLILERDPEASGQLIFRDGGALGQYLLQVPIHNGSFPQSVTTKSNTVHVRFEYKQPQDLICRIFPPCIRFLLEFTSSFDVDEEFRLLMSKVHDNIGYGVNIQDMRSKVRISNETVISNNSFGAGVRIYKGAGDIIINGTVIENNADAGVNITYSGGHQLINGTRLVLNKGYGIITEYLKLNKTRQESQNRLEVVRSKFIGNEFIGLRVGNYCRGGEILINESYFAYNYDDALEYLSCNISTQHKTKVRIEFNKFNNNFRHAIIMRPLLNTQGIITNNTFANHTLSTLRIDNSYDLLISRWYRDLPVTFNIFENIFQNNAGRYVINIRLTQGSATQNLYCKFNYFQQNEVNDSFPLLNPRSRANAVVVLSSSNVQFRRNYIDNPGSARDVATHLVDPSVEIDAKENYWGMEINRQADYAKVHETIFDQDDRYNLAKVLYHPALKTLRLYENYLSNDVPEYVWEFQRNNVLGGLLEKTFVIGRGRTYYVDRDIYIVPDKTLLMEPDSKLMFKQSIGMVVHGVLRADGMSRETPVVFDLDDREESVPVQNRTASVRLVDGSDEFEGRLEVEINSTWGTVCRDGWTEENSLLVCQQLGLSFDRDNPGVMIETRAAEGTPVLMSWVSCDDVDVDLAQCRSVNIDAGTCGHDKDVFLRCQKTTWAGITLAAAYKLDQNQPIQSESQIRFAEIKNAGLLDPDTATLTPALRIDYNYYQISWLTVLNSVSDGIRVSYNQPYSVNKMEYLTVMNCMGNGIVTKSPKLEVMHSRLDNNKRAGFLYDPFLTEYEALSIRNTIYPLRRVNMFESPVRILQPDQLMFLVCPMGQSVEVREYLVEVRVSSPLYKLSLQVLDYLPVESVEKVTIFDSDRQNMGSTSVKRWEIEKDLVDFPILSGSNVVTIKLKVNGQLSGRLVFAILTRDFQSSEPNLLTAVTNTTFSGNYQGIVTKHYNNPSNKRLELFHRHKEEHIYIKDVKIHNSASHAMYMPSVTKFSLDYIPTYEDMTRPERIAKIVYTVNHTQLTGNAMGVLAEHNHVDFANNVWQWRLDHLIMQETRLGGLEIELPRVNDETEREIHAVSVLDSNFLNNQDFAFTITGYYAQLQLDRNGFTNNKCRLGLIRITGMEKNMTLNSNAIKDNNCRYLVDMDILSHSEYFATVTGQINLNYIMDNFYDGEVPSCGAGCPRTYGVALKGLQNVTASYNLFRNPTLDYELVAGITSILLGSVLNVTLNFWGYSDQPSIRDRIFDFDDWNNFAIAEYFPYLTMADPNSIPSTGIREPVILDPNHLGGRVEKSQTLMELGKPYIVQTDLTVLPGVTLTIPPGTELQFMPNVGILVLGRLIANGLPHNRIRFKPVQASVNPSYTMRTKRQASTPIQGNVRLRGDGTLFKDEGFLELYNASTKSWNIMCDSQFNEKSAEVVCRELAKEVINVKVRFTHLYDYYIYGKPMYFRKEFWYNSYYCRGDETSLKQCSTRYNYNLLPCVYAANYTFITCGKRNLDSHFNYWGNIRFAMDAYEEKPLTADIGIDRSSMNYVDIVGAGVLHGEKVGAVQSTYVTPIFKNINISNCADNGYDIIAPRQDLNLQFQNISGNLGFGVNILVLNGETSVRQSSFQPSGPSTLPYSVHGLVDMCRLEKDITVETRLLLFFKYGPNARDCVKRIRSRRTVGLRFLQVNIFQEDFSRNSVEIYDGTLISSRTRLGHIVANSSSSEVQQIFQTSGDIMTVHVHASVSFSGYGFIAEVVRLPLSGLVYPNSEYSHTIWQAEIRKNEEGAIQYKNVGEVAPSLFIEHCWLEENGYPVLNLTSPHTIDISLQSSVSFRFSHNQVTYNRGGMLLSTLTSSLNTALRGNLTNNVFAFGRNGEALKISGHYFQRLMMFQNYFYNYTTGDYQDVVHIKNVVVNLTHNYLLKNVGHYIIHTYSSDDASEPQMFARNGIYDNNATALREATIKVSSGRPRFVRNFLVNNLNDFEIMTYPRSGLHAQVIDAKDNWWGSDRQAYISGKTYDFMDDKSLVEVDYLPPILDNRSLVEGDCFPGWVLDKNRCYRYMGGALPFEQAKLFCRSHGAFLAEARNREDFFNYLLRLMVIEPDWRQRVWVMSDTNPSRCAAFERSYIVYEDECNRRYNPFICETDPELANPVELTSAVKAMIIGISVGVGCLILIIILVVGLLWYIKSKKRRKERFDRTASKSSLNNLTKINSSLRGTRSTLTVLSVGASRQRLNDFDEKSVVSSCDKASNSSTANNSENVSTPNNSENISEPSALSVSRDKRELSLERLNERPIHSLRPDRSQKNVKKHPKSSSQKIQKEENARKIEDKKRLYGQDSEEYNSEDDDSSSDNSGKESKRESSYHSSSFEDVDEKSGSDYSSSDKSTVIAKQKPYVSAKEKLLPQVPVKPKNKQAKVDDELFEIPRFGVTSRNIQLVSDKPKPFTRPKPAPPMRKPSSHDSQDQTLQSVPLLSAALEKDNLFQKNKMRSKNPEPLMFEEQHEYAVDLPYGVDQKPDDDYMPRPLGNTHLGLSRERLDVLSPSSSTKSSSMFDSSKSSFSSTLPSKDDTDKKSVSSMSSITKRFPSVSSDDGRSSLSTQLPPYSPGSYTSGKTPLAASRSTTARGKELTQTTQDEVRGDHHSKQMTAAQDQARAGQGALGSQSTAQAIVQSPEDRNTWKKLEIPSNQAIGSRNDLNKPFSQSSSQARGSRDDLSKPFSQSSSQARGSRDDLSKPFYQSSSQARGSRDDLNKPFSQSSSQARGSRDDLNKPLPPKPPDKPRGSRDDLNKTLSQSSYQARGSRDELNKQLPPQRLYEKRGSKDLLNKQSVGGSQAAVKSKLHQNIGSRERLDLPPPPPSQELKPRQHGGSGEVLYLAQGSRTKKDSVETEI